MPEVKDTRPTLFQRAERLLGWRLMHKPTLFLKCHPRVKDGKEHRYWSLCENRRTAEGQRFQRQVIYLGEINDSQKANWIKQIEVFDQAKEAYATVALFPEDRVATPLIGPAIQIRLAEFEVCRPRQWGACWLALWLWRTLQLDEFWAERLPPSREGTQWRLILKALSVYRLIDPGSEWRFHRQWFDSSALSDLLGPDFQLGCKENVYRTLDKLLVHKEALFTYLRSRWEGLFGAKFDVLLYDLTSTYFESDPPFPEGDKRRFGYSRDKRSDCVQVVIALVLTSEGLPVAYEVFAGNTSDKTTLEGMLQKIEKQYGKAAAHLADGPGHSDRGDAGADAAEQSTRAVFGGHAQRTIDPSGKAAGRATLDAGAGEGAGQSSIRKKAKSSCWRRAKIGCKKNEPCARSVEGSIGGG